MNLLDCAHPDIVKHKTRDGRRYSHGSLTEAQIQLAEDLSDAELASWANRETLFLGALKLEVMLFLIQLHCSKGRRTGIADELTKLLHHQLYGRVVSFCCRQIGITAAKEFAADFCSEFWIIILDWQSAKSAWAQVCFWPTVFQLVKNAMKKHRRDMRLITSLDSDLGTRAFFAGLPASDIALDDLVYVNEVLGQMSPSERLAFALRHSCDASIKEIGNVTGQSETKVKKVLRTTKMQFRDAA
ncbi:MAG TPA: hypothetical protein VMS31_12145 [Pyrinomonadaceae bacterium]|nr:hypothetical protein [Pyrinomonadaceae bacterium]